jgi:hypothetical protein
VLSGRGSPEEIQFRLISKKCGQSSVVYVKKLWRRSTPTALA